MGGVQVSLCARLSPAQAADVATGSPEGLLPDLGLVKFRGREAGSLFRGPRCVGAAVL